jgi:YVTN family beta-propeller protein
MRSIFLIILLICNFIHNITGSEIHNNKIFIKAFPQNYSLYINSEVQKPENINDTIREYLIPSDTKYYFLRSEGYHDKYLFHPGQDIDLLEIKMEHMKTPLIYMNVINTGSQPKSVEFSKSGEYFAVALLNGSGVEIYSVDNMDFYKKLKPPAEWLENKGFVESVFFKTRNELWVSQMTTGMIHVFNTDNWDYKLSFDCGGSWPKVIILDKDENTAFISNWTSKNISVINTSDYSVKTTIPVNGIPRGMSISPDGKYLYVGNFTSGDINKIDIEKKRLLKNIELGNGALRHVVISEQDNKLYVSDMFHGTITVLNLKTDSVIKSFYVGSNINTIKLSPDNSKLYISSRGQNSENGYLQKGPYFGKIFVYDTVIKKITNWTWAGNQPTGLAVSPDGEILAFTNFLDHRVEIYRIIP